MDVHYLDSPDGLRPGQLDGFFEGWPHPPDAEEHLEILRGSDLVVLAQDAKTERIVGFITAITDGHLAAYIPLLEVIRPCRGHGIGSHLVRRMMERLDGTYMIDLVCDEDVQPFYQQLGWTPYTAMIIRNPRVANGSA